MTNRHTPHRALAAVNEPQIEEAGRSDRHLIPDKLAHFYKDEQEITIFYFRPIIDRSDGKKYYPYRFATSDEPWFAVPTLWFSGGVRADLSVKAKTGEACRYGIKISFSDLPEYLKPIVISDIEYITNCGMAPALDKSVLLVSLECQP